MDDIRNRRLALGLSQAALAKLMGVNPSTIHLWEHGQRGMTPGIRKRLDALLTALEQGKQPPPPKGVLPHRRQGTLEKMPIIAGFIRAYLLKHHIAPVVSEIERGVGFPVRRTLEVMEQKGLIARSFSDRGYTKGRTIRLTGKELQSTTPR